MADTKRRLKTGLIGILALGLAAPGSAARMVGADRDRHGCIGSAGYSWSPLRRGCLRLFEKALRLDATGKAQRGAAAFVLFRSDEQEGPAELHLPGAPAPIALHQTPGQNAGEWRGGGYRLSQWRGMFTLEHRPGRTLFQGPAAP